MPLMLPPAVQLVEVGPRDGLQSLSQTVPTALKVELINRLSKTGLSCIEVTSFVRPDVVPQLADAVELMEQIERQNGVIYRALVPNRKGAERATAARVDELLALVTVSESYCRHNQNMSVQQNLAAARDIYHAAISAGAHITFALATSFFCPYTGPVSEDAVLRIVDRLVSMGATRLYLADTAGMAAPTQVRYLIARVRAQWPAMQIGLHLHNTNGMALANALAGLDAGIDFVEGAICGMGGGIRMPRGMAVGNVPTEDLAHMLALMGVQTGVDLGALVAVSRWFAQAAGIEIHSHALAGGLADELMARTQSQ